MILHKLELFNFRNYRYQDIEFSPDRNLITGRNAQGKTNLLEAVYFLSYLKPKRAPRLRDLVLQGEQQCSVRGLLEDEGQKVTIKIALSPGGRDIELNGQKVDQMSRARGVLKCVLFAPDDLYLVKGEPSRRRDFMDESLEALGPQSAVLGRYRHILRQRNALLKHWEQQGSGAEEALAPWTEGLIEEGAKIILARTDMVERMREQVSAAYEEIAGDGKQVDFSYAGSFEAEGGESGVADAMREALRRAAREERRIRTTMVGPHRDEVSITLEGREARYNASQGEQRTLAYSMRVAQLRYIEAVTGKRPVLLLDDVLSELDEARRGKVLELAGRGNQAVITATEPPHASWESGAATFVVEAGRIAGA